MKFSTVAGRYTEDPEKALLPTIMYIDGSSDHYAMYGRSGFALAFGWWDWSISFCLHWERKL